MTSQWVPFEGYHYLASLKKLNCGMSIDGCSDLSRLKAINGGISVVWCKRLHSFRLFHTDQR